MFGKKTTPTPTPDRGSGGAETESLQQEVRALREEFRAFSGQLLNSRGQQEALAPSASPKVGLGEAEIFSEALLRDSTIVKERKELLEAFVQKKPEAQMLVGQLLALEGMVAKIRAAKRMGKSQLSYPQNILNSVKDIGRWFYEYAPKTENKDMPMEDALKEYIDSIFRDIEFGHKIQLIRVGSRFDSKLHLSTENGAEVEQVGGWSIIRRDGVCLHKGDVKLR